MRDPRNNVDDTTQVKIQEYSISFKKPFPSLIEDIQLGPRDKLSQSITNVTTRLACLVTMVKKMDAFKPSGYTLLYIQIVYWGNIKPLRSDGTKED